VHSLIETRSSVVVEFAGTPEIRISGEIHYVPMSNVGSCVRRNADNAAIAAAGGGSYDQQKR
jgi:hypothetical protein